MLNLEQGTRVRVTLAAISEGSSYGFDGIIQAVRESGLFIREIEPPMYSSQHESRYRDVFVPWSGIVRLSETEWHDGKGE